jgi:hypothetical protein
MPGFDAILVPGGGVRDDGSLPDWVRARFDAAIEVSGESPIIALSGGTAYKPSPRDSGGFPVFESIAGAAYLLRRGVPRDRVLFEIASYDTIGNAFYTRAIHTDPRGWRKLLVITSEFHMPRTEDVFQFVFGLDARPPYELSFESTPDGPDQEIFAARRAKERKSLEIFQRIKPRIRTYLEFQQWLFAEHDLYAADRRVARQLSPLPEAAIGTY